MDDIIAVGAGDDVGADERAVSFLILLNDDAAINGSACFGIERRHADESGSLHDAFQIDVDGAGDSLAVVLEEEHLTFLDGDAATDLVEEDVEGAFENDDLDPLAGHVIHHDGCSGDCGGGGGGPDAGTSGVFGNLEKEGALLKLEVSSALLKAEDRIGSKAGDGGILELQFGAGLGAGLDGSFAGDSRVNLGGLGGSAGLEDFHIIDDAGDLGGLEGGGVAQRGCCQEEKGGDVFHDTGLCSGRLRWSDMQGITILSRDSR